MTRGDAIARLRAAVRESGSPLADVMRRAPAAPTAAPIPARSPRRAARRRPPRRDVELAVSCAVARGLPAALRPGRASLQIADPDLALLAGDRLYALGLARLAAIGDLDAIAELADIIALSAQAHAAGDDELALAAWHAGAAAIGWGADDATAAAKELARAGDPGAAEALHAAAARAGL